MIISSKFDIIKISTKSLLFFENDSFIKNGKFRIYEFLSRGLSSKNNADFYAVEPKLVTTLGYTSTIGS